MGLGDDSLSIVIPFYNEPENAHAILTIIANYRQSDIEWVLVNNGSTDQVTASILESSEQIRYICLDANVGFGGGFLYPATPGTGKLYPTFGTVALSVVFNR